MEILWKGTVMERPRKLGEITEFYTVEKIATQKVATPEIFGNCPWRQLYQSPILVKTKAAVHSFTKKKFPTRMFYKKFCEV